jgi:16S rRNA C1402 (ribose-2'-O) methylase RsmI
MHEEIARGTADALARSFEDRARGEITIVISAQGTDETEAEVHELDDEALARRAEALRAGGEKLRGVAKRIADETGMDARTLYDRLSKLR